MASNENPAVTYYALAQAFDNAICNICDAIAIMYPYRKIIHKIKNERKKTADLSAAFGIILVFLILRPRAFRRKRHGYLRGCT